MVWGLEVLGFEVLGFGVLGFGVRRASARLLRDALLLTSPKVATETKGQHLQITTKQQEPQKVLRGLALAN